MKTFQELKEIAIKNMKFKPDQEIYISKMCKIKSHFPAECFAHIVGSYASMYNPDDTFKDHYERNLSCYTVRFKDGGEAAWYDEENLIDAEKYRSKKDNPDKDLKDCIEALRIIDCNPIDKKLLKQELKERFDDDIIKLARKIRRKE